MVWLVRATVLFSGLRTVDICLKSTKSNMNAVEIYQLTVRCCFYLMLIESLTTINNHNLEHLIGKNLF